jgi:Domain of unknown function DUF11
VPDLIPGIGQPSPTLAVGVTSQIPLTLTNAGQANSSGLHTMVFTLPVGIVGPIGTTTSNGWTCGAQAGSTVTCTKTTSIAPLGTETLSIPVIPGLSTQGLTLTYTATNSGGADSNITNNSASVTMQVAVAPAPIDTTPPTITSVSLASGSLLPTGTFPVVYTYTDTGAGINSVTTTGALYSWNSGTLSYNAVPLTGYMTLAGNTTT